MTLPASGTISMSDVATELGVSLPLSLDSSAVRGLAGVSSGPISMSDLYGKSSVLVADWGNTILSSTSIVSKTDADVTMAGFGGSKTLRMSFASDSGGSGTIYAVVNGSNATSLSVAGVDSTYTADFTVSPGDAVHFQAVRSTSLIRGTMSILDMSKGGVTVDTFGVNVHDPSA